MKKNILYQYLGTNGTILSPVHLEGIYYVKKIQLIADKGMILSDNKQFVSNIIIPESDLENWKEVPYTGQK